MSGEGAALPADASAYTAPSRAAYAEDPARSRGRRHPEPESATRTAFARDRDRVIHCSAFRRLKEKTQVFVAHEGDHFRTRLTHSLEVAQIARSLAKALGLDDDLAEGVALAHDLGHPPFAHAGEDQLQACMAPYGGFDHNVQTFRVLVRLERRYPEFEGLNLCWETLEGVVKHNGPATGQLDDASLRTHPGAGPGVPASPGDLRLGGGAGGGARRRHRLQQPRRGRRAAGRACSGSRTCSMCP